MTAAASLPTTSFWNFSLAFYALPGVADACLELQERCGADVNVLLFLLYAAAHGRMLDAPDVAGIEGIAAPWRQAVVAPLRAVRRALKEPVGAFEPQRTAVLRSEIKRIELAAERVQQETLECLAAPATLGNEHADRIRCACAHLRLYAAQLGCWQAEAGARLLASFAGTPLAPG